MRLGTFGPLCVSASLILMQIPSTIALKASLAMQVSKRNSEGVSVKPWHMKLQFFIVYTHSFDFEEVLDKKIYH